MGTVWGAYQTWFLPLPGIFHSAVDDHSTKARLIPVFLSQRLHENIKKGYGH